MEMSVGRGRNVDRLQRGEHFGPLAGGFSGLFKELDWKAF